ncbi:hypothetical protein [Lacticaseibacillus jixiensis]|uniref:hypothetical protein n=1 Tax=Lacticaseibacillus jixiensis TaxID=3231926 RepID=UPI0036F3DF0D
MRRMQHKKRKHWGRRIVITLLSLVLIVGLGAYFFPQLNNTYRNLSGNDTPADTAVKSALKQQLNAQKTGNAATDQVIDQVTNAIDHTQMATLMKAADDQQTAKTLLVNAGVPATAASTVTSTIFSDPAFDPLRQKLAAGDYAGVYQAAKTLQNSGDYSQLSSALQALTQ